MIRLFAPDRTDSPEIAGTLPLKATVERKGAGTTFAGTLNIAGMSVVGSSWKIEPAAGEAPASFRGSYTPQKGLVISSLEIALADSRLSASGTLRKGDVSIDLNVPRLNLCDLGSMVCAQSSQVGRLFPAICACAAPRRKNGKWTA